MADAPLGVLQLVDRGGGFIRRREASYLPDDGDVHVPARLVGEYGLRTGDELWGEVGGSGGPPGGGRPGAGRGRLRGSGHRNGRGDGRGRARTLVRLTAVNGRPPVALRHRPDFARLPAVHPDEPLRLEHDDGDPITRVIDLLCPLGKGQRALVVAPAKAGKTTVLQAIARGVARNHPGARLLVLLVDERPEEVTEMELGGYGEVVASSFDFPAPRHVAVAELTLERARRGVESGEDVVIILDSITRLARAYNAVERGSGRTLSGGLDAGSLEQPKRFLGSARKVAPGHGGGSLTIIGTALVDTGSRMDQVIFEEFKGTGNSELVLSRELAERRLFPAIDLNASATRREELLLPPPLLEVSRELRRRVSRLPPAEAMQQVLAVLRRTRSNAELAATPI